MALWSGVVETGAGGRADGAAAGGRLQRRAAADGGGLDRRGGGLGSAPTRWCASRWWPSWPRRGSWRPATGPSPRWSCTTSRAGAGGYTAAVSSGQGGLLAPFRKLYQLMVGQRVVERTPLNAPACGRHRPGGPERLGPGLHRPPRAIRCRRGWAGGRRRAPSPRCSGRARPSRPAPALLSGLAAGTVIDDGVLFAVPRLRPGAHRRGPLSRYPYGCTEQLVSAAYPLMYAQAALRRSAACGWPRRRSTAAVSRLLDRQIQDGAVRPVAARRRRGRRLARRLHHRLPGGGARPRARRCPTTPSTRALAAMRQISRPQGFALGRLPAGVPADLVRHAPGRRQAATQRLRTRASAYALYVLAKARVGRPGAAALVPRRADEGRALAAGPRPCRGRAGADGRPGAGARQLRAGGAGAGLARRERLVPEPVARPRRRDRPRLRGRRSRRSPASCRAGWHGSVRDVDSLNTQEQARLLQAADAMLRAAGTMRIQATGRAAARAGRAGRSDGCRRRASSTAGPAPCGGR